MQDLTAEYICVLNYDDSFPNEQAWRTRLAEIGLDHNAFTLFELPNGKPAVKFWEPNRPEALRIVAKLDTARAYH